MHSLLLLLHLDFKTWVSGLRQTQCFLLLFFSLGTPTLLLLLWLFFSHTAIITYLSGPGSQDLALRTWLSGPGFQDSDRCPCRLLPLASSTTNPMFCLVPKHKTKNQNKPNVLFGTQAQSKKPKKAKCKAKNQRKERLFLEENPSVHSSESILP